MIFVLERGAGEMAEPVVSVKNNGIVRILGLKIYSDLAEIPKAV